MSTGAAVPAPIEPQEKSSAVTRVLQTIYAPAKAFTGMNGKTAWILPWILISVVTLAFFVTIDKKIGFDKVVDNQIKMSPKQSEQLERLPEAQRERQIDMRVKGMKYGSFAAPVTVLIMYALASLILWGTFTFACSARLTFGTTFSVVMLSAIPGLIKMLLAIVAMFAGVDPDGFNIQNPLATNLGPFFDRLAHPFLYSLGSGIDVFMIWTLIVLGIGFSTVSKVKRSTAMTVVFSWYAVVLLGGAALASAFS
jgi:hypothetical protein